MSTLRYPNILKLNNVNLTDESRGPLTETRDERSVIVELASGKKIKFIKGIRKKWSVTWENIGMSTSQTVDGYGGRNEIRAIAQQGGTIACAIQDGVNSTENYTVFISSYQEQVIMRRTSMFRYTITMEFEEQG